MKLADYWFLSFPTMHIIWTLASTENFQDNGLKSGLCQGGTQTGLETLKKQGCLVLP